MFNPGTSRTVSDYTRVENTLADMTSEPHRFEGSVYPRDDVEKDLKQLDDYKHTPEYKKGEERSDAKLLERTFTDMVERDDWFGEDESYGDDSDYLALVTFPTTEIDDTFNHIDVIGMISNEVTNHKTLPFAIDLTYNTDNDKMGQKFRWKHAYGKKGAVPDGISEFGESYLDKDYAGNSVTRTRALPLKFRNGLKIPGFASAKYFEDTNNPSDPMHEMGRIDVMPRLIVGYSPDIADALASGMPTEEDRWKYGQASYDQRRAEYETAKRCAKWCTLFECRNQSSNIRYMLEHMNNEETKWMDPKELGEAKKQIVALDTYFSKAIQVATANAQNDPDEMTAMKYADRDVICQAILSHSNNTYIQ